MVVESKDPSSNLASHQQSVVETSSKFSFRKVVAYMAKPFIFIAELIVRIFVAIRNLFSRKIEVVDKDSQVAKVTVANNTPNHPDIDASTSSPSPASSNAPNLVTNTNKSKIKYDLARFITAQDEIDDHYQSKSKKKLPFHESALEQLKAGEKVTHWIWFIFPQEQGLGSSGQAIKYGLKKVGEAIEYLKNETLAERLITCIKAIDFSDGSTIKKILASDIDFKKFKSSMDIFNRAIIAMQKDDKENIPNHLLEHQDIFANVLKKCK